MLAHLCAHPWSWSEDKLCNKQLLRGKMGSKKAESLDDSRQMNSGKGNCRLCELKCGDQNDNEIPGKFLIRQMKKLTLKTSQPKPSSNPHKIQIKDPPPDIIDSVVKRKLQKAMNDCVCSDFESFLNTSSIQEPANIPMVIIRDVVLRATGAFNRKDVVLAMGNVVNGIHKTGDWIFVQTAQGKDGYIPYNSSLPLGIRPPTRTTHSAAWEIAAPYANQTDIQKLCEVNDIVSEFDIPQVEEKQIITVVCDYIKKNEMQISVSRGENVTLVERKNNDWLQVRTADDREGLIPLAYTSAGKQLFF